MSKMDIDETSLKENKVPQLVELQQIRTSPVKRNKRGQANNDK